jgi:hypothetical protein
LANQDDSSSEIERILEMGKFEMLIGKRESPTFEAKCASEYDLKKSPHRYELAKDVSAFANMNGGTLVIGLETERAVDQLTDVVRAVTGTDARTPDPGALSGVIDTQVWPRIKDLSLRTFSSVSDGATSLIRILVPPQNENRKPFLIRKAVVEGEEIGELVFGLARRLESGNVPMSYERLHEIIRRGERDITTQLDRIEAKLEAMDARHLKTDQAAQEKDSLEQLRRLMSHMRGGE